MKFTSTWSFFVLAVCCLSLGNSACAAQSDIIGPAGSGQFGTNITLLPNGNFVVTDPEFSRAQASACGAVYLYDGATLQVISQLTGSSANDHVGFGGIVVLSNGNFLVSSPKWHNGAGAVTWATGGFGVNGNVSATNSLVNLSTNNGAGGTYAYTITPLSNGNYVVTSPYWNNSAGSVTWGSGTSGVAGVVSAANSLVGSASSDMIGTFITVLPNGNYVVSSSSWNNGAGAVTWASGTAAVTGTVSAANSLIGGAPNDDVGDSVIVLKNGNYVVSSPYWQNGAISGVGAVTWCDGSTGATGIVSPANSLVGSTANDNVGIVVTALSNGNYVVASGSWDNGGPASNAGAVTWCPGGKGRTGTVAATNSLVGTTSGDGVGFGVVEVGNGNYVVISPSWHNGAVANAGAVTWGNGTNGVTGAVSQINSLVGSTANDTVGYYSGLFNITLLTNGNYVVGSPTWHNGTASNAGAATFGKGTNGVTGMVSAANSLVGTAANDMVGRSVIALNNGNYVVGTYNWHTNTGAATWGNGTSGRVGVVSSANSLVGSTVGDFVGSSVIALSNNNYVVVSSTWHNGPTANAGAVTWGNGATGVTGAVSAANSLVGAAAGDYIGSNNGLASALVTLLTNGNYVVCSPNWHNGSTANAGAATWCNGTTGKIGAVSTANSLVGTTANDLVGYEGATALNNGNYVVSSTPWHNVGAATWGNGSTGIVGAVSSGNSLVGSTANDLVGGVIALNNGNYLVNSLDWHNGGVSVGAVTWGNGNTGVAGTISAANSLIGTTAGDNVGLNVITFTNSNYLVVSEWNSAAPSPGAVTYGYGAQATTGTVNATNSFLGTIANGLSSLTVTNDPFYNRVLIGYPAGNLYSVLGFNPQIAVEQPTNVNLVNGDTRILGAPIGQSSSLTFIIKNMNVGDLTGIAVTIDGSGAARFNVTTNPATQVSGPFGSTSFTVRFTPTTSATASATLHILSNDSAHSPFNINLSGKALLSTMDSDGDGMSDAAEFALAALGFDWQVSQTNLVAAYYSNANTAGLFTTSQVEALNVGSPLLEKDSSTGLFKLTIGVQHSTDLTNFSAFPMSAGQTTINGAGELEFQFSPTNNAAFFRVESH